MLRPIPKKKNEVQDIPGSYLSDDSVIRLASDSRQGEKFKALCNGEIPEGKSHSDADMSLASILAFWCGGDTEQMENININITLMGNHTLYTVGNWSLRINFQRARNHAFPFVNWRNR